MFTRQVTRGERTQGALTSSVAEESLRSMGLVKAHGYERSERLRFGQQLQVLAELGYLKLVGYAVSRSEEVFSSTSTHKHRLKVYG